jgi:hypothetical protein
MLLFTVIDINGHVFNDFVKVNIELSNTETKGTKKRLYRMSSSTQDPPTVRMPTEGTTQHSNCFRPAVSSTGEYSVLLLGSAVLQVEKL